MNKVKSAFCSFAIAALLLTSCGSKDPNVRFRNAVSSASSDFSKNLVNNYDSQLKKFNFDDFALSSVFSLELGKGSKMFVDILKEETGVNLDWVKHVQLDFGYGLKEKDFGANLGLALNNTKLASGNLVCSGDSIFVKVPELLSDFVSGNIGFDFYEEAELGKIRNFYKNFPTAVSINSVINDIVSSTVSAVNGVTEEKKSLSVNYNEKAVENEYSALTLNVTEEISKAMYESAKTKLSANKNLDSLIKNILALAYSQEEVTEETVSSTKEIFINALESFYEALSDSAITLYVDSADKIAGFDFVKDEVKVVYQEPVKGKDYACNFAIFENDEELGHLVGAGILNGDKYSGNYTLVAEDKEIFSLKQRILL